MTKPHSAITFPETLIYTSPKSKKAQDLKNMYHKNTIPFLTKSQVPLHPMMNKLTFITITYLKLLPTFILKKTVKYQNHQ